MGERSENWGIHYLQGLNTDTIFSKSTNYTCFTLISHKLQIPLSQLLFQY